MKKREIISRDPRAEAIEIDEEDYDDENRENATWGDDYDLKKIAAEVHSKEESELNKDFTLANLSDDLFNSKIVKYINDRIGLLKLLEIMMPYCNTRRIEKNTDDKLKRRILIEKLEYSKLRKLILSEVRVFLFLCLLLLFFL